jgi:hypothetical protein
MFIIASHALANTTPKFAYVANYFSNIVSAYTINSSTRTLTPVSGSPFAAGTEPYSVAIVGQYAVPFAAARDLRLLWLKLLKSEMVRQYMEHATRVCAQVERRTAEDYVLSDVTFKTEIRAKTERSLKQREDK